MKRRKMAGPGASALRGSGSGNGDRPAQAPLALVTGHAGRTVIAATDALAEQRGIRPGQSLAGARALEPGLRLRPFDDAGDHAQLARFADWATRYAPHVALEQPEPWRASLPEPRFAPGIWIDVTGSAHLFGGEEALLTDIMDRFRAAGFSCRAALADTPGAAWAMARFMPGPLHGRFLVPSGGQRRALEKLPLMALRLPPDLARNLAEMGINRIGDLHGIPRAPLAQRFGNDVIDRFDAALGRLDEAISPQNPKLVWEERRAFAEPIGRREDVEAGLAALSTALVSRLGDAGRGVRSLELALYRVDNTVQRFCVGTVRPSRDGTHLAGLLRERLSEIDPGFGFETMTLRALVTERLAAEQMHSLDRGGTSARGKELGELIDRLSGRLGTGAVAVLTPRQSHLPERAEVLTRAAFVGAAPGHAPLARHAEARPLHRRPLRPVRLLGRPEAVQVVAPVPDGPPILFRWRGDAHRVTAAEGPERIAPEWWRLGDGETVPTRDYYRVEDMEGRRYWLYREGLYGEDGQSPEGPSWFLHGFFA